MSMQNNPKTSSPIESADNEVAQNKPSFLIEDEATNKEENNVLEEPSQQPSPHFQPPLIRFTTSVESSKFDVVGDENGGDGTTSSASPSILPPATTSRQDEHTTTASFSGSIHHPSSSPTTSKTSKTSYPASRKEADSNSEYLEFEDADLYSYTDYTINMRNNSIIDNKLINKNERLIRNDSDSTINTSNYHNNRAENQVGTTLN